jgi:hypothetical protein
MRNTSIIRRVRLETDGKDIVAVVAGNVQIIGSGLVMLKVKSRQLKLRNMLGSDKGEAVKLLAGLRKL